ncbi:MAG: PP2C family protein-serine/threonine phosphatase [Candidatus Limnocylindria bacterium]
MIDIECAGISERGARPTNEDRIGSAVPVEATLRERKGALFVLADGLGGHLGGEVASETAVRTLIDDYYGPSSHGRIEPALQRAVQAANLRIYQLAQRDSDLWRMATTLVAVAITDSHAYIAHVGDSRVYHWRAGTLTLLTSDHSEAAELFRRGFVRRERLSDHPARHALTRTLGSDLIVRPDFIRHPVAAQDRFLLCTDGLWSAVTELELSQALAGDAQHACRTLADRALAAGSEDNVSVQVAHVTRVGGTEERHQESRWRPPFFVRGRSAP